MSTAPDYAPLCAPPDREPRAPRTAFPPLACDTHAHIFEARFPYAKERLYTPPDSNLGDYKKLLKTLGCERAVLVQPSVYGADNSAMLDALNRAGPGFRAVAVTDPGISDADIKSLHRAGVRGLRFNVVDVRSNKNQVPADMLRGVAKRIAPHGWHIEMLVNLDEAGDFAPLLGSLGVPVVLGHLGYPKGGAAAWTGTRAFADLLQTARRRAMLDQADRALPHHHCARPALRRHRRACAKTGRSSAGTDNLGHRLAACDEEEADAQRRRHGRSAGALGSGRCIA